MNLRAPVLAMTAGVLGIAGVAVVIFGLDSRSVPPSLPAPPAAAGDVPAPAIRAAASIPRATPDRLVIPAISVDAAVVPEGTDSSGALELPPLTARNLTGWWDGGVAPGQDGPAVIVGHVDNVGGPLVFWNLRLLKPGDTVETEPGNLRFLVTRVMQVAKATFPTTAVYGPTKDPELRLITCGGTFDFAAGHYSDNVIVYAREN